MATAAAISYKLSRIPGPEGRVSWKAMKVNCNQHSKSMELLNLKVRLEKGISDQQEKELVLKRIKVLESELELD